MDNQTPDQTPQIGPNEAPSPETARASGLRRLFKRRPMMAGTAIGAMGLALALAVAGVVTAGAQSSDDPPTTTQPAASTDDDSDTDGTGDDSGDDSDGHGTDGTDGDGDGTDGDTDATGDDGDGHGTGDDGDSAARPGVRGLLHRFGALSAEDQAAFESFKTCLAAEGVEGLDHDEDGTEVSVMGPDGFSIVQLGDGSVTVTRAGDDVTITTTGDATVMGQEDLKAAWQAEAAAWKSAFEGCRNQLPEGLRDFAAAGKRLGERFAEDFDKDAILAELGIEAGDLAEIGEHFAEEFAGFGEHFAEEFAGFGEGFAGKGWW